MPATRYQPTQQLHIRATRPLFGSAGTSHLSAVAQPFIPGIVDDIVLFYLIIINISQSGQIRSPMGPTSAHNYQHHHNVHDTNPISRGAISGQMSATAFQQIQIRCTT